MLDCPSIVCRVLRPFARPIVARVGHILTIWPGHPTHCLTILDAAGAVVRATGYPEGKLYGDLLHLFLDAAIVALSEDSERRLLRVA